MLFCSDNAPKRPDYFYESVPGGGFIGWHKDAKPTINRRHIDGPLLYMRTGELHWLTLWERVLLFFGRTDAEKLESKYRPRLKHWSV